MMSVERHPDVTSKQGREFRPLKPDQQRLGQYLDEIASGDESAMAGFYELTVDKAFAIANAIIKNQADAEEAVYDAYTQVWKTAEKFQPGRGSVIAWFCMIVRSRCLDLLRQRKASLTVSDESVSERVSEELPPETLLDNITRGNLLHRALGQLSSIQQHVVTLAYFRDLSHSEIADQLEIPLGTVKSHARRAVLALRAAI